MRDDFDTPVIFRVFPDGDVIALFPSDPGTYGPYTCGSYQHVGRHGSADPQFVTQATRPARPPEFTDLKRELESAPYGYRLKLYRRLHRNFLDQRRARLSA